MSRRDFAGQRVWLTGASSGIGAALAAELVARGAHVALSARSERTLEALAERLGRERTLVLPLDVTDPRACRAAGETLDYAWGALDVAVLNAGTCEYVDTARFESAPFRRQIDVNYMGVVHGVEAALPLLRRSQRPRLAGMASAAAYRGLPRAEAYGASKAAARYFLQALRLDLRREGIPVSVICPGFVQTPLTDQNDFPMPFLLRADKAARRIADGIAAGRPEIHFPRRLTWPLQALALLPERLADRLLLPTVRNP